ncbi:hypothetical protein OEZ85_002227 [Tetradesmus obliquus]|uniref:Uncharacterized protein n=1 Tax=Tetradesmus obliquus TaxID=3088 RepID=A0ABY8U2I2_TETOB|nr:hypothetical protein OEZ85_002227 [Tetradesmus obliquus]
MEAAAAQQEVDRHLQQQGIKPLHQFVYQLYSVLLGSGWLFPCREDMTLTLLRLPREDVFVSVYESNSDDSVHGWIDMLQLALNVIGTPSRIVSRGMIVRSKGQERIDFLAQLRNIALAPLYNHYASSYTRSNRRSGSPASAKDSSNGKTELPAAPGTVPWDPDYVVFINDVYFCWSMVLRLMNYRADITCGMDFWQKNDATTSLPTDLKVKGHQPKPVLPPEYRLEAPLPLLNASSPDQLNPIVFYDIWVARDLAGSKFWWTYPFNLDVASGAYVKQGLPVRASCCWNGLSILAAEPFKRGLRFRSHIGKGSSSGNECRASECSLVCDDFARLGFDRVVVDAGVQVAYKWGLAREMMAAGVEGIGQSTWAQIKAAGVGEAARQPAYGTMECCSLQPGAEYVAFYKDCSRMNVMSVNYTAQALSMSSWRR